MYVFAGPPPVQVQEPVTTVLPAAHVAVVATTQPPAHAPLVVVTVLGRPIACQTQLVLLNGNYAFVVNGRRRLQ